MDVSRVSMVTPKVIDWRKLTAKDIIKYDSEGMTVPSEYLSWARAFHVDLEKNDTDDTTYEMAVSKPVIPQNINNQNPNANVNSSGNTVDETPQGTSSAATDNNQNSTTAINSEDNTGETVNGTAQTGSAEGNEDVNETGETDETQNEETSDENLTAEEKKKKLEEDGEGLFSIAMTFKGDSETKAEASDTSANTVNALGESSDNAIASLDSYMNELLSQANDIKSQINSENNKNNKTKNDFAKILKLEQELKNLGTTGQNVALGYDTDLNMYQTTIDAGTTIGLDAQDYGGTTIDLGKEVKRNWIRFMFGSQIENAGKNAVSAGQGAIETSSLVSDKNNANLNTIQQHQSTIYNETGVLAEEAAGDNKNSQQNQNANTGTAGTTANTNTANTSTKTSAAQLQKQDPLSGKDETPAQKLAKEEDNTTDDKKTDVEKKEEKIASGNLDEILKRKMRRGETV